MDTGDENDPSVLEGYFFLHIKRTQLRYLDVWHQGGHLEHPQKLMDERDEETNVVVNSLFLGF